MRRKRERSGERQRGSGRGGERGTRLPDDMRGWDESHSELHEERLEAVARVVLAEGVSTLLDVGCGSGALLRRLAPEPSLARLVGMDPSERALRKAEELLAPLAGRGGEKVELRQVSVLEAERVFPRTEAAVLVEVIEHLPPQSLSQLERGLLGVLRPRLVVITTPNREYNGILGVPEGELRHPDHAFEWGRSKFRSWAGGCASRAGYQVEFEDVGAGDAWYGAPTQMAVLRRKDSGGRPGARLGVRPA